MEVALCTECASTFVVLVVAIHQAARAERRVWTRSAIAFATVWAVLTGLVYFVQLTLVAPRLARGQTDGMEAFRFVPFDPFLHAADVLGYSFMSVATLIAAQASGSKEHLRAEHESPRTRRCTCRPSSARMASSGASSLAPYHPIPSAFGR